MRQLLFVALSLALATTEAVSKDPYSLVDNDMVGEWENRECSLDIPNNIVGVCWVKFLNGGKMQFETGTPNGPKTYDGLYKVFDKNKVTLMFSKKNKELSTTAVFKPMGDKILFYPVRYTRGREYVSERALTYKTTLPVLPSPE